MKVYAKIYYLINQGNHGWTQK